MGRYHKFKLGLAILFYAAYCVGPMNAQNDDEVTENVAKNTDPSDYLVYYQAANPLDNLSLKGVEGKPGVDFPILSYIPRTTFNCRDVESGYYADLDTDCQVFHICEEGKKISFLCPNGTIFQQSDLICEWWFKVNCTNSPHLYDASAEQWRTSVIRRKASRRVLLDGDTRSTGAVLRTEEHSSVSARKNGKHVDVANNVQNRGGQHRSQQRTSSNYRSPAKQKVDSQYINNGRGNNEQKPLKPTNIKRTKSRGDGTNFKQSSSRNQQGSKVSFLENNTQQNLNDDNDTGSTISYDNAQGSRDEHNTHQQNVNRNNDRASTATYSTKQYRNEQSVVSKNTEYNSQQNVNHNNNRPSTVSYNSKKYENEQSAVSKNTEYNSQHNVNHNNNRESTASSSTQRYENDQSTVSKNTENSSQQNVYDNNNKASTASLGISQGFGPNLKEYNSQQNINGNSNKESTDNSQSFRVDVNEYNSDRNVNDNSNTASTISFDNPRDSSSKFNNYNTEQNVNQDNNKASTAASYSTQPYVSEQSTLTYNAVSKNTEETQHNDNFVNQQNLDDDNNKSTNLNANYQQSGNEQGSNQNHNNENHENSSSNSNKFNNHQEPSDENSSPSTVANRIVDLTDTSQHVRFHANIPNIQKTEFRQSSKYKLNDNNNNGPEIIDSSNLQGENQHVRFHAGKPNQIVKNNSGKVKLTLSTVNNAINVNGQPNTQAPKANKKPEGKNIKLTLNSVNNQVSFDSNKAQQNNLQNTQNIPTNRGGFKYNQDLSNTFSSTSGFGINSETNGDKAIISTQSVNTANTPTFVSQESSSTVNQASSTTVSINNNNLETITQSTTSQPKQESKKVEAETKGDVKQKSTVALTRNDIVNRRLEPSDSDETQITQESSSFVKSSFNTISNSYKASTANPYPNHRTTYSDLKQPSSFSSTKIINTINSVTPQYLTTQPINNGKPFVGSRVGTTLPVVVNVNPTSSYSTRGTTNEQKTAFASGNVFIGSTTGAGLPSTVSINPTIVYNTTPTKINNIPQSADSNKDAQATINYVSTTAAPFTSTASLINSELFNTGKTDSTLRPVPFSVPTTQNPFLKEPLSLFVPDKFNLGINKTQLLEAVKNTKLSTNGIFNLGLGRINISEDGSPNISPRKAVDHKVVYGTFTKGLRTTTLPSFDINQGVQIKFDKNTKKVGIQLSKAIGGPYNPELSIRQQLLLEPEVSDKSGSILPSNPNKSGFFVTREAVATTPVPLSTGGFNLGVASTNYYGNNNVQKPRPFEKIIDTNSGKTGFVKVSTEDDSVNSVTPTIPTFPTYKISTASPFTQSVTVKPTLPTPFKAADSDRYNSVYENVDNMLNVLMEIAKADENDYENDTPRPGLVVPPSAGPQTLHTLAVYFANALDGIVAENEKNGHDNEEEVQEKYEQAKQSVTTLLTKMTLNRYNELFDEKENKTESATVAPRFNSDDEGTNGLEGQDSIGIVETPHIRQLARNFSIALSSYLDDPEMFRRELQELRPTEPPQLSEEVETTTENTGADEELLNFSDADSKSSYPPIFPTIPSVSPTWGYILAYNVSKNDNLDVKNSLTPDLQGADSQSFVPRFNNLNTDTKFQQKSNIATKSPTDLPPNHWTSSPDATKLWKTTFGVNPVNLNQQFGTTPASLSDDDVDINNSSEEESRETLTTVQDNLSSLKQPHSEIKYDLRRLPQFSLNSTQVHGILIDFMNTTKTDDNSRLQRILHKLNTTENEFINKMREIESNPLTKRLILLLISECGANITKEIESGALSPDLITQSENSQQNKEIYQPSQSRYSISTRNIEKPALKENSNIPHLVGHSISEEDHDARALQLLNSLYTIASRFGK